LTWDLLFYVPLPWVGPVITPVMIAATMAVAGSLIIYFNAKGYDIRWRWIDTAVEVGCAFIMIVAFCWDWRNILQIPSEVKRSGIPNPFAWWLFLPGYFLSIVYFAMKLRQLIIFDPSKRS
jgi:hypothetical protein